MDAYSCLFRGEVFANAQTGNVLLFSIHLSKGEWLPALHYAFPIAAFLCGVALAVFLCHFCRRRERLHWRQICVLFEAVVLFSVAWIPQSASIVVFHDYLRKCRERPANEITERSDLGLFY